MISHKKKIGIVIYANPDYYPPLINTIQILAKEFDLVIICRNQDKPQAAYPDNVRLYRLGKFKTSRGKEAQNLLLKVLEYLSFTIKAIFYLQAYYCRIIYSCGMYGLVASFLAGRFGKRIPLIYHNFDLEELKKQQGLSYIIKYFEPRLARYADKVVLPDINRAKFFHKEARLNKLPDIVMNTPLCVEHLPPGRLKEILKARGIARDTKVVLYQGTINQARSLLEVIQSMVFWPKDTILALIGEVSGDFIALADHAAERLGLKGRIQYLAAVSYSELLNYTAGAYLGLALYKPVNINQLFNAGASNKLFEYLSLGIPAITNDSDYFREVLDSSVAYFARPDCIEDIARAVNSAVSDIEEYKRKSRSARIAHLTKFNYQVQFRPILEYIRELGIKHYTKVDAYIISLFRAPGK